MIKRTDRKEGRSKRHRRVRVNVSGTSERPRLAVYRSLNHLYAQVIDDGASKTVAAASTVELKAKGNGMSEAAQVGKQIAAKAKAAGVNRVVFDRGGVPFHGRIKALADAAREAGLEFLALMGSRYPHSSGERSELAHPVGPVNRVPQGG